ncbi:DUF3885 domain-containing protein [Acrocarpospora catenulata]|uniref:DUF3885 domain-containing protein n=1 Tax=Acrocarpospora catenulata TaxID=2836182 RepID=UPI003FD766F8
MWPCPRTDPSRAEMPSRPNSSPPYAGRMTWNCVLDNWPELSARWQANWPDCPPVAHELKRFYASRWVRFHSLPESKRYADTPAEAERGAFAYSASRDRQAAVCGTGLCRCG